MRHTLFTLFSCLFLLACEHSPEVQTLTGYAQGTTYSVKFWQSNQNDGTKSTESNIMLKQSIDQELARIDKVMSNYRDDSLIEQFNQKKVVDQAIPLDKEILDLLKISNTVYKASKHCYDPTIKPLFQIWGFSDDKLQIPNQTQINQVKQAIGFDKLKRDKNGITKTHKQLTVDLSAIGQGYAVAKIADILKQHKINNFLVEIGGEMLVSGEKPNQKKWRVGIERPIPNSQKVSEVITLTGKRPTAIMTSGTYRHYFDDKGKKYSHILDPRTGKPVTHDSVAVTVMLDNATHADAWSTALLCLGSQEGLKVANEQHIPAIFYDLQGKTIKRQESQSIKDEKNFWQIEQ